MAENSVAARLKTFINSQGLTDSQFADACKISRATLSLFLSGKNKKINDVLLGLIHNVYPSLSIPWLIFGEGEMLNRQNSDNGTGDVLNNNNTISTENLEEEVDNKDTNSSKILDENIFFIDNHSARDENAKEIDENIPLKAIRAIVNQEINQAIDAVVEVQRKIAAASLKRRVVKITVFFDDNTFQTFVPGEELIS